MAKRRLTGRQLRFLFARGVLRSKGSGKNRRVEYNKSANATSTRSLGRNAKRKGLSAGGKNVNNKFPRTVIGGSKAAGLRSGSGSGKRDFSGTRAERLAAGREMLKRRGLENLGTPEMRTKRAADPKLKALQTRIMRAVVKDAKGKESAAVAAAAAKSARQAQLSTREGRIAAGRQKLAAFESTPRGDRVLARHERAVSALGSKADSMTPRQINRFRVRQDRAERTLKAVKAAQRFTYNGFRGDKRTQSSRYANLKRREERIRKVYGL